MIEHAEVEHSILLAGCVGRELDGRMESSLLGRNVRDPPRRRPAARLPLHGRRQLRDRRSSDDAAARHRRRRDARARRSSRGRRARRPRGGRAATAPSSTSPTSGAIAAAIVGSSRDAVVNCAAWTDVDGAEDRRGGAEPSTPTAPATSRARARPPARGSCTCRPTTSSTARQRRALRRVRRGRPARRLRRARSSPARSGRRGARRTTRSSAPRGCSAPAGANFVDDDARARRGARRGARRHRPDRLPDVRPAISRPRCVELAERTRTGIFHVAGAGPCSWHELAVETFEPGRRRLPRAAATTAELRRARRRGPAYSVLGTERERRDPAAAVAGGRSPPTWPRTGGRTHEAAGLRRRRVHRLELRPPARARRTATRSSCSTSSPTPGREENLQDARTIALRARRDRGPATPSRDAIEGFDAVVNFAAETHVDRSIAEPDAFVRTHAQRHLRAARGGARAPAALRPGLDRRGLRLDRGGLVHRVLAAGSRPRPTARPRPAPTCSSPATSTPTAWRRDLPRLQQLRALPVPREADPADDPQRAARRPAAGLRRRHERAQLDLRRGLRPRHRPRARARRARRGLQRRRPRRVLRTSRSSSGSSSSPAPTSR